MKRVRPNPAYPMRDPIIRRALIACAGGFSLFLLWAIFAPLAEGVTVSGKIVVEDNRKVVQHLEGGIVRAVRVREGDVVEKGQVLIELERVAAASGRNELAQEMAVTLATFDRLTALAEEQDTVAFPSLDQMPIDEDSLDILVREQTALFHQQRKSLQAEIAVLERRRQALQTRINDLPGRIAAADRGRRLVREELANLRPMLEEQLVTFDRVQSLERELARLDGELAELRAVRNETTEQISEVTNQIAQVQAQFEEGVSAETLEARRTLMTLRERLEAADDVLTRTAILAPQSGQVLNLEVSTVGAVVRGGDPVMEIVPANRDIIVEVQVRPGDRDSIYTGLPVEAQLSAYKRWQTPRLEGEVLNVSADLKEIPATGEVYYAARVRLDPSGLVGQPDLKLSPGMPVEAFVASGQTRSFIDYMLEPITATVARGLRMS